MVEHKCQVQVILSSIYSHCNSLCTLVNANKAAAGQSKEHCLRLKNLCCKILLATNNEISLHTCNHAPNIAMRSLARIKLSNNLKLGELSYNGVTMQQVLEVLGPRLCCYFIERDDIAFFFPVGKSSVLQVKGMAAYSNMKQYVDIRSKPTQFHCQHTGIVTAVACQHTEPDPVDGIEDPSIIADAEMFVSMLGDEELNDQDNVKESSNPAEISSNISASDNTLPQETSNVSSEELFSSVTTKDGSVIIVSSGSFITSQPEKSTCKRNSATHESTTGFKDTHPTVSTDMTITKTITSSKQQIEIKKTSEQQTNDAGSSSDISSSDEELSGNSSDDVEFLSNREYLKRKKHCHKEAPSCKRVDSKSIVFLNGKASVESQASRKTTHNRRRRKTPKHKKTRHRRRKSTRKKFDR